MFENAGDKLKTLAKVVFGLSIVSAVVCFITGLITLSTAFLYWFLYAALCVLSGWISGLMLTALGDAAQSAQLAKQVKSLERKLDKLTGTEAPAEPKLQPAEEPSDHWEPVAEAKAIPHGSSNIRCANCGKIQFSGNKRCLRCGAEFITEE